MSRSDWLAILGIILTVIFGIPTIPLFAKGNIALGFLVLVLFLVTLALTLYHIWKSRLPPYTILCHHGRVDIQDDGGKTALYRKTLTLRPNHPGLEHYTHRNLSADGTLTDFRVNPEVLLENQGVRAGDYYVSIRFFNQLPRGRPVTTWLEATCRDCFTKQREGFIVFVDQPTRAAKVEVVLPRKPYDVRAIFRYSGRDQELEAPAITGNSIVWERSQRFMNLPFGEYEVSWSW